MAHRSDRAAPPTPSAAARPEPLPESPRSALGARIAYLRRESGLTQEGLAERAGIDPSYVTRIEAGARTPSLDVLKRLAAALEVDSGDLASSEAGPGRLVAYWLGEQSPVAEWADATRTSQAASEVRPDVVLAVTEPPRTPFPSAQGWENADPFLLSRRGRLAGWRREGRADVRRDRALWRLSTAAASLAGSEVTLLADLAERLAGAGRGVLPSGPEPQAPPCGADGTARPSSSKE